MKRPNGLGPLKEPQEKAAYLRGLWSTPNSYILYTITPYP